MKIKFTLSELSGALEYYIRKKVMQEREYFKLTDIKITDISNVSGVEVTIDTSVSEYAPIDKD